jgi:F-type H+-transporting ATPase subunit epsilon
MEIKIVTPNGVVYNNNAKSITMPTRNGVITVLEDHQPLVSILEPGEIVIKNESEEDVLISVSSGLVEVHEGNIVYVIADTAELAEYIDIERAEDAAKKAQEELAKLDKLQDIDFAKLQASIDKEMARVNVGKKYRNLRRRI